MIDGKPRRWLLVSQELPLRSEDGAAPWFVDHLFLDQEGVPTVVEVKRSSDSRIRREVVGQVLDYAANAVVRWPVDTLRGRVMGDPETAAQLAAFLGEQSEEAFWAEVQSNMERGRVRMVFVADEIPPELRRIVDFLADQMRNAEVFAVEVRNFQGEGERALVPRLVSKPKSADSALAASVGRRWDKASFFEEMQKQVPGSVDVARSVFQWSQSKATGFWYGAGMKTGSCYPEFADRGRKIWLFAMRTSGEIEVPFQDLRRWTPFEADEKRRELAERLNSIPGVEISEDRISKRPSFAIVALADAEALGHFLQTMEWVLAEIRGR